MRTWEDNAHEFGALSKQGVDVRLAVLVATSVERTHAGRPVIGANAPIKVSARDFAEAAGTTHQRIMRHLDAWNRAAGKGLCTPSADLTPDDATDPDMLAPSEEDFKAVFTVPDNAGGRTMGNIRTAADTIAKRGAAAVIDALEPETVAEIARAAITKTDPITRDEIVRESKPEPIIAAPKHGTVSKEIDAADKRRRDGEGLTWVLVDDALEDVHSDALHQIKRLAVAMHHARGTEFTSEERDDIMETLRRAIRDTDRVSKALSTVRDIMDGSPSVDWDAELAKLTEV